MRDNTTKLRVVLAMSLNFFLTMFCYCHCHRHCRCSCSCRSECHCNWTEIEWNRMACESSVSAKAGFPTSSLRTSRVFQFWQPYQHTIRTTNTPHQVQSINSKWYSRLVIATHELLNPPLSRTTSTTRKGQSPCSCSLPYSRHFGCLGYQKLLPKNLLFVSFASLSRQKHPRFGYRSVFVGAFRLARICF